VGEADVQAGGENDVVLLLKRNHADGRIAEASGWDETGRYVRVSVQRVTHSAFDLR
jgi:hypothetical protein